jgi:C4-type Zn-finger protein
MGIIFFGTKQSNVGIDEQFVYCPSCEAAAEADLLVASSYFHIYFLPLFPVSKEVSIICKQCGLKRYDLPFNKKTINNYAEIKNKFRHPWFTYIFLGCIALVILLSIIYN